MEPTEHMDRAVITTTLIELGADNALCHIACGLIGREPKKFGEIVAAVLRALAADSAWHAKLAAKTLNMNMNMNLPVSFIADAERDSSAKFKEEMLGTWAFTPRDQAIEDVAKQRGHLPVFLRVLLLREERGAALTIEQTNILQMIHSLEAKYEGKRNSC